MWTKLQNTSTVYVDRTVNKPTFFYPYYADSNGNNINNPLADDYFIGRWFPMIQNGQVTMTAISGGQEIRVNFANTTTIGASFYIDSWFTANAGTMPIVAWNIDDGAWTRTQLGADGASGLASLTFATGLTTGTHKLRIIFDGFKETAPRWVNGAGLHFVDFVKDSGGTISPVTKRKKIVYVGDSITEGVLVLGGTVSQPSNNAAHLDYTHLSASALNCDPIIVAYGATGAVNGGNGGVPATKDNLFYYKSGFPVVIDESPSLFVINIGTNDSGQTDSTFIPAYQAIIDAINAKYSTIKILCTNTFGGYKASAISQVVDANQPNCYLVDTASWGVIEAGGGGLHPNSAGHQLASDNLVQFINTRNLI